MKAKLASIGRILVLAVGLATIAASVLIMVTSEELAVRITAMVALAGGVIILLLAALLDKLGIFSLLLRHVQYMTQSSQYTARLVQEIAQVMQTIQKMEEEEQQRRQQEPAPKTAGPTPGKKSYVDELSAEELHLASTLQQFEE